MMQSVHESTARKLATAVFITSKSQIERAEDGLTAGYVSTTAYMPADEEVTFAAQCTKFIESCC
jgi:hypothetical protein